MVLIRIRRGLSRLFDVLDGEGVGVFQAIVYIHVVAGGLYGAVIAGGTPQAVEEAMGHLVSAVWLWLCMGAVICLIGKAIMRRAANVGMWLQLTGDLFVFGVFGGYVLATISTSYYGRVLFAVFVCAALAECVMMLIVRDVRRIAEVERIYRRQQ